MNSKDMSDCGYLPLPDVLSFIVDNRGKTVPTAEFGIPLIATNCIKNNELYPVFEKIRYLSEETYKNWFRAHPIPGDIIFVNKGAPGRVCLVPDPVGFCIAQDMMAFRVNDKIINNKYLFAVLRSPQFQTQIEQFHVGTLIPHFKKGDLDKLLIPVPSMNVQKFIGETYYDLCSKIEVNNRINKNLEEMAQAIFKSWFVDFEPFRDGEFEDSELGRIPKGWRVGALGECMQLFDSKRVPLSSRQRANIEKKYPYYGATSLMDYVDNYLFDGLFVLLGEDGSVIDSKGYPILQYVWGKFWVNNHAHIMKGKNGFDENSLFMLLKNTNVQSIVTGAVQLKINQRNLNSLCVIIPSKESLENFNGLLSPLFEARRNNEEQISRLIKIRDSLLPKLMSGEIRVPTAEVK
ncbi:restriction endonuclease subunit S [Sedimentibacter sp. zth1]|uniref:restriction endonuclease subunit S n=1 Tax=Sedimentibacter sp. zth1 TaxID=2816908 RepID=UPI001F5F64B1|nr:restriction endonuclease subunit S [Sedimentibacter sp. zth1]